MTESSRSWIYLGILALGLSGASTARADQSRTDCSSLFECIEPGHDSNETSHQLTFREPGGHETSFGLADVHSVSSLTLDFDRWMWSKFDKSAVTRNYPHGAQEACSKFESLVAEVLSCTHDSVARNDKSGELTCGGGRALMVRGALDAARDDGFLKQLGRLFEEKQDGTGKVVSSTLFDMIGVQQLRCEDNGPCKVTFWPGKMPEKSIAAASSADGEKRGNKTVASPDSTGSRGQPHPAGQIEVH